METNGRAPRETPSNPERHQPRRLLKLWEPVRTALMAALAACDLADMHQHPALKVVRGLVLAGDAAARLRKARR